MSSADIVVSGRALQGVASAMEAAGAPAGAPALHLCLAGCPWYVRSFYRVWRSVAWSVDAPIGSGIYMLSEAGHAHVGGFPTSSTTTATYTAVSTRTNGCACASDAFIMFPPRTLRGLVLRRTRTIEGQIEMHRERFGALPGTPVGPGPLRLLRSRPWRAIDVLVFLTVTALSHLAVRRKRARGLVGWERDESSRQVIGGGAVSPRDERVRVS